MAKGGGTMDKWDRRFMEMAHVIAGWTSCYMEGRSIGCVIVKDKRIMTTGYNGAPAGLRTCRERQECMRRKLGIASGTRAELCYAIHAEQNAIINADSAAMEGATIYIVGVNADGSLASGKPCLLCRRMLRNAKLARVVYYETDGSVVSCRPDEIHD